MLMEHHVRLIAIGACAAFQGRIKAILAGGCAWITLLIIEAEVHVVLTRKYRLEFV